MQPFLADALKKLIVSYRHVTAVGHVGFGFGSILYRNVGDPDPEKEMRILATWIRNTVYLNVLLSVIQQGSEMVLVDRSYLSYRRREYRTNLSTSI